ncbi:hypothetical protein FHL15_004442 [Xylaria flabelliformis]|uniref:Fungal lipase-type domain-containing protein n=1 Tax=Xylaria flabelliformis TaxID=2512241 RepID=A0A553I395_9PEZI|nr:hypothetical protein FHL15_004442 [Xylaria flabelliformis]
MDDPYHYNLFQQIYCLSMATGIVSNRQDTEAVLQAALKESLNEVLPQLTGNWSISWGPRVYKEKNQDSSEGGPDNVWFAAVDDTQKICVVAIAGTASNSLADIYEDINVYEVVDFNAWVKLWSHEGIPEPVKSTPTQDNASTTSYCARGTCIGVWNVLSNVSTEAGEDTRIDQYLTGLDPSYTVVVTGHSLGGALAPIVALGLVEAEMAGSHKIKVLPSAGVSPGNANLAADYATTFPKDPSTGEGYQVYNTDYYNTFDIVPQAWSTDTNDDRNLHNILDKIIHTTGEFRTEVENYVNLAIGLSQASQIRYTPLPGQSFTGPPPPVLIQNWDEAKLVLSTQHVLAYWSEFGITEFVKLFDSKFSKRVGAQ